MKSMPLYPPSHALRDIICSAYLRAWSARERRTGPPRSLRKAILERNDEGYLALIAEYKRSTPLGPTRDIDLQGYLEQVLEAGATALSVLAEPLRFNGSPDLVAAAAEAVDVPVLYKGFIVKEEDVEHAYQCGADAVLLIARILSNQEIQHLARRAHDLGLEVLLEVSTWEELLRALRLGVHDLLGVNSRDLASLRINHYRALKLMDAIPGKEVVVYMSGIEGPGQAYLAAQRRANAILVGTALMNNPDVIGKISNIYLLS